MSADVRAAEPTPAERVRSVLAAATSLTVTTDGHSCSLMDVHHVDDRGRLGLRLPAGSCLAGRAAAAPRGGLAALVEFTDIAPTAVRERVRARVTLSGWLTPVAPAPDADTVGLRLDAARATLETAEGVLHVGLDEIVLTAPDPLATHEPAMLIHLADSHPEAVERLTRLIDPHRLQGVVRVLPLALDRYALTLRLEHPRGHHDVRLPFPRPMRNADEAGDRLQELLATARACSHRRRMFQRP
ncbi:MULTISPECIES: DUF2470 domain-containing protein [unclassified Streptomyces]|uniref:DUF2470 domain-containing protein n=1 Tax=unclassified Streptomyces TaxID=2593676 RepID=UPI0033B05D5B